MDRRELSRLASMSETIDSADLQEHKDDFMQLAIEGSEFSEQAADVVGRLSLEADDISTLSERHAHIADTGTRMALLVALSRYQQPTPKVLQMLQALSGAAQGRQVRYLASIAANWQLPATNPIVQALIQQLDSAATPAHLGIHVLYCIASYLEDGRVFRWGESLKARCPGDALLIAGLDYVLGKYSRRTGSAHR